MAFRHGRRPKRMPPPRPGLAAKAERRPMAASRPDMLGMHDAVLVVAVSPGRLPN